MTFKEYMALQEGLRTILNKRIEPNSPAASGAKAAGDLAIDMVPGAGAVKAIGGFVWDVLKYRQKKADFDDVNKWAAYHHENLLSHAIDPYRVFHMNEKFGQCLSDQALHDIMTTTLQALDRSEHHGYVEVKKNPALAETVAFKYVREHLLTVKSSIQGSAGQQKNVVQPPTAKPPKSGWYNWKGQYWFYDGTNWRQGEDDGKNQIIPGTRDMMSKPSQQQNQQQNQKGWW